ncbi:mandelate racemase/muconate lactonizing enzyme family protein [Streptomyces sp. NPDC001840]
MKITDVRLHAVEPKGKVPSLGGSPVCWLFIEVETDAGVTGIGECSNWPGQGNDIVAATLRTMSEYLVGRDPLNIEQIWNDLFRRFTYLGSRGAITTAVGGIDIALWDIKGKVLNRPVYDVLGGAVRSSFPLYTHPVGADADQLAANAAELVGAGFSALKFDPFHEMYGRFTSYLDGQISTAGVKAGARLIEAVRDEVGPDIEILIDLHGSYNVASALRCIHALEDYGITWFEEPFPPESLEALSQLRAQTSAALCVGERLHTRWDFLPVLRDRLVNYVMPDVSWTGGISELRKISTMAEAYTVPVSPHGALGPVHLAAAAHVMAATPNFYRLEILGAPWQLVYRDCLQSGPDIRDGNLFLSDRPGLGVELDRDFLDAFDAARE